MRNNRPVLGSVFFDDFEQHVVFIVSPLGFVASNLLDKQPSFFTLLGVFGGYDLCHLIPIVLGKVLYINVVLYDVSKQSVLKKVCFVVFPLS